MQPPLVSCILPTYNRRQFFPNAIRYFQRQDYTNKELIILDDGTDSVEDLVPAAKNIRYYRLEQKITLGAKLNMACSYASGNIIANWDDDDWYAPHRLSYQASAMQQKTVAVCGINKLLYLDLKSKQGLQYIYPKEHKIWLSGSSLCFTKELWESLRFADVNVGMDGLFVWATPPERIKVLEDNTFAIHMIHDHNVSPKNTDNIWWHPYPVSELRQILNTDWKYYSNGHHIQNGKASAKLEAPVAKTKNDSLKNIYACLVHEQQDCIIDLVRNLHFHDPDSVILLYNGSQNPQLIPKEFPFDQYGAVVHPQPQPQKHGYLHHFAFDCMAFVLENFAFDTLTIVDSDQLAIRSGYSQFLTSQLLHKPRVGLFSNMPERITLDNKTYPVALQAFNEFDLWKPFLQQFPDGENQFVYWTFWPSTVFTYDAVRDVYRLFKEDKLLQNIIKQTKIWATEEVIFPTLIKLLGYNIATNPCSYDYIQYRKFYTSADVDNAICKNDVFWIHPVERQFEYPLRKYIRTRFDNYNQSGEDKTPNSVSAVFAFQTDALIQSIKQIEGWLSDAEANLMINTTIKALHDLPLPHNLVEIGSYHGKSTVLLGTVAKAISPQAKLYAIDPHNGQLGAVDQGLQSFPPSLASFQKNIQTARLSNVVELIQDFSFNITWNKPIALLYIDGLHDYTNVSRDFQQFSAWIQPGAYVIFHDYADYYPGVKRAVEEILQKEEYQRIELVASLMVLQKRKK